MQINNVTFYSFGNNADFLRNRRNINQSYQTSLISFMGRRLLVRKDMPRFYPFNEHRMPETVKGYLAKLDNMFKISPMEAQKKAFEKLKATKTIQDVKRAFPKEELFNNLQTLDSTESKVGLIGIYKENKEKFKNGILKSGADFTVYLLIALYAEAKTYEVISKDLDNDLVPDMKKYFHAKYKKADQEGDSDTKKNKLYVYTELLDGLGIQPPNSEYKSSLLHTDKEFSDAFRIKISEAVLRAYEKYTPEERAKINAKRLKGLDEWLEKKSHDELLELAAKINEKEELDNYYKDYKDFRERTTVRIPVVQESEANLYESETLEKKKELGSNLKNKDLFVLFMKGYLEKFRADLSDEDAEIIHIKMSKRQAERWEKMSPQDRTEYINKLKSGSETTRYAMIDAWNHSRLLIKALAEFMRSKRIERPVDLIYSDEKFKEVQSKAMTEFWAENEDLAKSFGVQIKYSHTKVENAVKSGQFETLKADIETEKAQRKAALAKYFAEEDETNVMNSESISKNTEANEADIKYRKDFINAYRTYINKNKILPASYYRELNEIMLDALPKDFITKCTEIMNSGKELPADMKKRLDEVSIKDNSPRMQRMRRSLEIAIASELSAHGGNPDYFEMTADELISILEEKVKNVLLPKKLRPDIKRIERQYSDSKKDLTDEEGNNIIQEYFRIPNVPKEDVQATCQELMDYIDTYGQGIKILFSGTSAYSDEIKYALNRKFLKNMPQHLKDKFTIPIQNMDDIKKEREIIRLQGQISRRLNYLPNDILKRYIQIVGSVVRFENGFDLEAARELTRKVEMDKSYKNVSLEKSSLPVEDKYRMVAIEQALEDELFRITNDYSMYSLEFEDAITHLEMMSRMTPEANEFTVSDGDKEKTVIVKDRPNLKNLTVPYVKYYKGIKSMADESTANSVDNNIGKESILSYFDSLKSKNPIKYANIKQKVEKYFD